LGLPGFDAEAALRPSQSHYRGRALYGVGASGSPFPQVFGEPTTLEEGEDDVELFDDDADMSDDAEEVSFDADDMEDSIVGDIEEEFDDGGSE